ncbi:MULTISPECIES: DUF4252 domain-containing protein [unclassified Ekhidna]|jgi:hypothetical protein|uniref:DUF4252 domain-containing protein n=1 Tax=unclassified Ekhidna TaxID=2632188 RepID=UPI0032E023C0
MKKVVLTIMILSITSVAFSQQVVSKYMDKYENDETFTKVSVSSKMFSLFSEMEGNEEDEQLFYDITSKLKGMKVIASEKVSSPKAMYDGAVSDVEKAGFEELMTVKDAEENVKISIREKGGIIEELILVAGGKEKFAMVSIYGEIDLKQISKLASLMRVNQLKYLENIDKAID